MSMNELLQLALLLPEEERAALAHELLLSLPAADEPSQSEWQEAWATEIKARMDRYERGETTARDWREVLADIQTGLKRKA
jgi:hypothetical protein